MNPFARVKIKARPNVGRAQRPCCLQLYSRWDLREQVEQDTISRTHRLPLWYPEDSLGVGRAMSCSLGTNPTAVLMRQVIFCSGTQFLHETSKRRLTSVSCTWAMPSCRDRTYCNLVPELILQPNIC